MDTDFYLKDTGENRLVYAQLPVASRVSVKLPTNLSYSISTFEVDKDKNKLHYIRINSDLFNYVKVDSSIQELIHKIKTLKFGN